MRSCAVRVKDAKCNPVPEIYNGPMAGGPRGCCRAAARAAGCSPLLLTSPGVAAGHRGAAGEGGMHAAMLCLCVLHGYYPQARNPDSSRNSCWIWNSLSSTDGSTMPPHPRADGPHHSSAETSLPRKPSVPESISSGGFEPTTSDVSRDPAPYLTSRPTTGVSD